MASCITVRVYDDIAVWDCMSTVIPHDAGLMAMTLEMAGDWQETSLGQLGPEELGDQLCVQHSYSPD